MMAATSFDFASVLTQRPGHCSPSITPTLTAGPCTLPVVPCTLTHLSRALHTHTPKHSSHTHTPQQCLAPSHSAAVPCTLMHSSSALHTHTLQQSNTHTLQQTITTGCCTLLLLPLCPPHCNGALVLTAVGCAHSHSVGLCLSAHSQGGPPCTPHSCSQPHSAQTLFLKKLTCTFPATEEMKICIKEFSEV